MITKLEEIEAFLVRRTEHGNRRALDLLRELIRDINGTPARVKPQESTPAVEPVPARVKRGPGRPPGGPLRGVILRGVEDVIRF